MKYIIEYVPRRRRLRSLDLAEELGEYPDKVVVVDGAEDLGDECASLNQELGGQLHRLQHELGLSIGVLDPGGTDVRRAIV